jgi:predicted enzyme related to lactoylglutathione lyase
MILGLRTVIYAAPDLDKAKSFYSALLGVEPYFDETFYVGYNVGGFELGLDPNKEGSGDGGSLAYWGVADIDSALEHAKTLGATVSSEAQNVGEGIMVASILDPFGTKLGLIENPHFDFSKVK